MAPPVIILPARLGGLKKISHTLYFYTVLQFLACSHSEYKNSAHFLHEVTFIYLWFILQCCQYATLHNVKQQDSWVNEEVQRLWKWSYPKALSWHDGLSNLTIHFTVKNNKQQNDVFFLHLTVSRQPYFFISHKIGFVN
jgi:hypothetical protein